MTRHRIVPFHRLEAIDIFDLLHRHSIDTVSLTTTLAYATMSSELCPVYAPFFGAMGCTSAIVFTCEFVPAIQHTTKDSHLCSACPVRYRCSIRNRQIGRRNLCNVRLAT